MAVGEALERAAPVDSTVHMGGRHNAMVGFVIFDRSFTDKVNKSGQVAAEWRSFTNEVDKRLCKTYLREYPCKHQKISKATQRSTKNC